MTPMLGLGKSLIKNGFSFFSTPQTTPWTPAFISTAVWLDANDASTITLNGSSVSEWRDKSGNARHTSQATAANQPIYSTTAFNGLPGIDFNGTSHFLNTFNDSYTTQMIAIAFRRTNGTSFLCGFGDLNVAVLQTATDIRFRNSNNRAFSNSIYSNCILTSDWNEAYFDGSALSFFATGTSLMTQTIGARTSAIFYPGEIAEIVVLETAPSIDTRQRIEGYLAWKWNLAANLPSTHPYKNAAPTVVVWTPAQITTELWLDANDSSTITLNGSNVSQWRDKSGNSRHVSQATAGSQPQYEATGMNGKPALNSLVGRFLQAGSTGLLRNVTGATLVAVSRFETPLTGGVGNSPLLFVSSGTSSASTRFSLNANPSPGTAGTYSVSGRRLDADAFATVGSSTAITANPIIWIGNANYSSAQANSWLNGNADIVGVAFQTTGSTSDTNALGLGVFNSAAGSLNIYNNTRISEAIIIHGALSVDTRQRLEGYLAWKWGLEANLPSGHPYKNSPPIV